MMSEDFYRNNIHIHFTTWLFRLKHDNESYGTLEFICENFLGIRADPRIDNIELVSYQAQHLSWITSRVLYVGVLEFKLNGKLHKIQIKQSAIDHDILSVEDWSDDKEKNE